MRLTIGSLLSSAAAINILRNSSKPIVTVSANITSDTTWTSDNIYHITADIQTANAGTVLTIESGTEVRVDDGVTIALGSGVSSGQGIVATGVTFKGSTPTANWRIIDAFYGSIFDVDSCTFTGATIAGLRPRTSSSGRVQINNCMFDRCGGWAGTTYAIQLVPYSTATCEFVGNLFSNTVSGFCLDYGESQASAISSPAVTNCTFDQNIRINAVGTTISGCVADAQELLVSCIQNSCTVTNNHFISRTGASNNVDLLNVRTSSTVSNNILYGGLHCIQLSAGQTGVTIRDNVLISNPTYTNEQIAFPGSNASIINNLLLQAGAQASIILADETGVTVEDNTCVGATPYNVFLNHAGSGGVSGQISSVSRNIFNGSTIAALYDEDNVSGAITAIGKNLYNAPSGSYKVQINTPGSEVSAVTSDPSHPAIPSEITSVNWDTSQSAATYRDTLFAAFASVSDGGDILGCNTSKVI